MDTDYIPHTGTATINAFKARIPNDTPELRAFLKILSQTQFSSILNALGSDDPTTFVLAVTRIQQSYQQICASVHNPSDRQFMLKFPFAKTFIAPVHETIYTPIHIPRYTLRHVANSCHMNACMSMLSSLTELVQEMNTVIYNNVELLESSEHHLTQLKLICQMLLNSYSELDFNNTLLERTAQALSINIYTAEESNETMKSIIRAIHANNIPTSTVLYWDTTHEFVPHEHSSKQFSEQISILKPKYLLVNIHDINSVSNNDTVKVHDLEYNFGSDCHYILSSLVIHYPGHFVAAFRTKNNIFRIIDDLNSRYTNASAPLSALLGSNFEHVVGAYIRV